MAGSAPQRVPTLPDFAQASTLPAQPTIAFFTGPACYDCHIKSCHLFRLKSVSGALLLLFLSPDCFSCGLSPGPISAWLSWPSFKGLQIRPSCIHISACTVLALIESAILGPGNKLVFHPDIHPGSAGQLSSCVSHMISTSYGISEWPFWKFSNQLSHEEILV